MRSKRVFMGALEDRLKWGVLAKGIGLGVLIFGCHGSSVPVSQTNGQTQAPIITTQPVDQSVAMGDPGNFKVVASGNPAPAYQWQKNGQAIAGASSPDYITPATTSLDDGSTFTVIVSNTVGSITSNPATLLVNPASGSPAITTQPMSQTVAQNGPAIFTVVATGSGTLSYQWTKGGANITGAKSATLNIAKVQAADAATYACVITNTMNGLAASATSANAVLTVNAPPVIKSQPSGQTVTQGAPATFTLVATGSGVLSYQWTKGGTLIPGGTSATLSLTNVQAADAAAYACVVTNNLDGTMASTTSANAALVVNVPPTITTQPLGKTVAQGGPATFSVVATGSGTLSYRWTKAGASIAGATSAMLSLTNVQAADIATYACVVTNTLNGNAASTTSTDAVLTLNVPPSVTTQALGQTVAQGGTATFTILATGSGTLSYQWTKGGTSLAGATSTTLSLTNVQAADAASYVCVITNTLNGSTASATSASAVLTVNLPPTIKTQPLGQTVAQGATANLLVAATGSGTLSYQWAKGGTNLAGATSATLSLANVQPIDAATYACVVTNTLGGTATSTTSTSAVLTVNLPPIITIQPISQTQAQGSAVAFAISATGSGVLTYQWTKNGSNLAGAKLATLVLNNVQAADGAAYACVVTNTLNGNAASTTSTNAVLTVNVPPNITTQPVNQSVSQGGTATFTITATGSGTLSYQWTKGGINLAGAASGILSLPNLQAADAASYACVVTNTLNGTTTSTLSKNATLTVISPPVTPVVQVGPYVTTGKGGLLASTANQGAGMAYSWTLTNGTISAGQGTPTITYTVGSLGLLTASVSVSNPAGSANGSGIATVVAAPWAELAFPPSVHPGDAWMEASVPVQPGMTYLWSMVAGTSTGTLSSGQGTGALGFSSGSPLGTFQIQGNVQNQAGTNVTTSATIKVQKGTWLVKNKGAFAAAQAATATLLPSGRVLVTGGYGASLFSGYLTTSSIYDPATKSWTATTGNMATARQSHTATLLPNGTVLVAGGSNGSGTLASAEIYNPSTGTWTATGSMGKARGGHTATLLQNGTVLVAGGSGGSGILANSEIYNPATKTWSPTTGSLGTARYWHTANLLSDGTVLVAGGNSGSSGSLASSEIFNPATKTWTPTTGALGIARYWHTATLLQDGTVLVTGGYGSSGYPMLSEIYNPSTKAWAPTTGGLGTARASHTATLLPDGTVLAVGGYGNSGYLAGSETYDPVTKSWVTTGTLSTARELHTAALLNDGTVLVVGGSNPSGTLANSEVYTPATKTWVSTADGLGIARFLHTATRLNDGTVLAVGGSNGSGVLTGSEVYDPAFRIWSATTAGLIEARSSHSASLLPSGMVLVAGGQDGNGTPLVGAELYDPGVKAWSLAGNLNEARYLHTGTLLLDGTVLVTGGFGVSDYLASSEIFNPIANAWTPTLGSMGTARCNHTATLLQDGRVLVVGGGDRNGNPFVSAEVYNPVMNSWTATGNLNTARYAHTATLLQNGKVLVAGGYDGNANPIAGSEIYDPGTGSWASTSGVLGVARASHTATRLNDGRVMVVGGFGLTWDVTGSELFDPALNTWVSTTGGLGTARFLHTATLLADGTVLVAFGQDGDTVTEIFMP
jgi:Immunoglobulin domain/Galactose oxidase, central domain